MNKTKRKLRHQRRIGKAQRSADRRSGVEPRPEKALDEVYLTLGGNRYHQCWCGAINRVWLYGSEPILMLPLADVGIFGLTDRVHKLADVGIFGLTECLLCEDIRRVEQIAERTETLEKKDAREFEEQHVMLQRRIAEGEALRSVFLGARKTLIDMGVSLEDLCVFDEAMLKALGVFDAALWKSL